MMGALKRFWMRSNSILTTTGTTTAYVLTYGAAEIYYNGEEYSFIVHATCGNAPTLNVNGAGARSIRKFSGGSFTACTTGDLAANQPIRVRYNSAALAFDIVSFLSSSGSWTTLKSSTLIAATTFDIISISSTINHLELIFDLTFSANNNNLRMLFYDAGGSIINTAIYSQWGTVSGTNGLVAPQSFTAQTSIPIATSLSNSSNLGASGKIHIQNIQGTKYKQANWNSQWFDHAGLVLYGIDGHGSMNGTGRITGVHLGPDTGTISGRVTVMGTTS